LIILNFLRGAFRLIGIAAVIGGNLIPIIIGVVLFKKNLTWTIRQRQRIARHLVWFLNIKIHPSGTPIDGNFLFIGNHRSYIDPVIAACSVAFMPVAKAEVAGWPLIGWGAKITGIVYVKRENKQSRADTRAAVREALSAGSPVLIYAEGTTSSGTATLSFRVSTFQVAAELGISVVPISIEYGNKSDYWVGNDTFIPHFLRTFGKHQIDVWIDFGTPISDADWEQLLAKTQAVIDTTLQELCEKKAAIV
jgi:lyso-ornithine lipid O-acyltransferase